MPRRFWLSVVSVATALVATGVTVNSQSTSGLAIPTLVCPTPAGDYVGAVLIDVTSGWLDGTPHKVRVRVTSNNGVPDEPHGEGVFVISEQLVNGDIDRGRAEIIIDWTGLDPNPTTIDHQYRVYASVIFADHHEGPTTEVGNFFLSDCAVRP
jgi:hypothetical protein